MSATVLRTMLRHAARSVRHGGLPFFFATLMTGLGIFGVATFATILLNLERATDEIGQSVGAVAFLAVESAADAEEARAKIALLPGIDEARLITPEAAMDRVRKALGEGGGLLEETAGVKMPWVVEVTPDPTAGVPFDALLTAIGRTRGVEEVMHPSGDTQRIEALMQMLGGAGVFLTLLVALVVIVVVSNTIKLTLFSRRKEIAIMKLVGATDHFVRVPFLLEGLVQGAVGAAVALIGVAAVHATIASLLEGMVGGALGDFSLTPLPLSAALWLLAAGALLGLLGALISIGRFLRV